MTPRKALEKIKNIEMKHTEFEMADFAYSYEVFDGTIEKNYHDEIEAIEEALDKLAKLEEIEELCEKIVSQPVYEKCEYTDNIREENYIDYTALYDFKEESIGIYDLDLVYVYYLKDYKKTWAFTKEELL